MCVELPCIACWQEHDGGLGACCAECSEKNEVVVDGEFVNSETIRASTPNYEIYGALGVDVRVSINGEGWTVNKIKFNYFANTAARNCIAYGPGLLENCVYGVEIPFMIQVRACMLRRGERQSLVSCFP